MNDLSYVLDLLTYLGCGIIILVLIYIEVSVPGVRLGRKVSKFSGGCMLSPPQSVPIGKGYRYSVNGTDVVVFIKRYSEDSFRVYSVSGYLPVQLRSDSFGDYFTACTDGPAIVEAVVDSIF